VLKKDVMERLFEGMRKMTIFSNVNHVLVKFILDKSKYQKKFYRSDFIALTE